MPKKILVIEDDPDVSMYLVSLFNDNGYETYAANDGDVGYEQLREVEPDLITLDLQMPKETGTRFSGENEQSWRKSCPQIQAS